MTGRTATRLTKFTPLLPLLIPGLLTGPVLGADRVRPLAKKVEIAVKLFGQDCKLIGPWDAAVLTRIHAIGPERVPSQQPLSQSQQSLKLVQASSDIPNALDIFRERLIKRLEQQVLFEAIVPAAKKEKSLQPVREAFQKKLNPIEKDKLDAALRLVSNKEFKVAVWDSTFVDRLTEAMETVFEPYPEEDYHRVTRKLGIEYSCVTEADSEEDAEE